MDGKTITLPYIGILSSERVILVLAFFIPFFISGPQLLTGTIVNALLFLYVVRVHGKTILPLVMVPSVGALLNGVIFEKFTVFLLYLLPGIWLGNYVLVETFRALKKKHGVITSLIISSILKSATLLSIALLLVGARAIPAIFLQLMGVFQLYTALMGGGLALIIDKAISTKS